MIDDEKIKALVASIKIRRMLRHFIIKGFRRKWFAKKEIFELHIYCTKRNTIVFYVEDSNLKMPFNIGDKFENVEKWCKENRFTISKE